MQKYKPDSKIKRHFDSVFSKEDPWSYESEYEMQKRRHLLNMLLSERSLKALEIGCAEGHVTSELASRVRHLVAVDIPERALSRAMKRCKDFDNISFVAANAFSGLPDGTFDLIVCSEVLYYVENYFELVRFRNKLVQHLAPGGVLLLAHALNVTDDKSKTGFDFDETGSKCISEVFGKSRQLDFERELRTEVYRMQLFRKMIKKKPIWRLHRTQEPNEVIVKQAHLLPTSSQVGLVKWGGCKISSSEAKFLWRSPDIPILLYHRIAETGPEPLRPYRMAADTFERQLAYLQRHGYRSVGLGSAVANLKRSTEPPSGRLVSITFDDAYEDFFQYALPLLRRYGFSATVFVPVQHINGFAEWDRRYGDPAKIMNWDQIQECALQGIGIGSHTMTHPNLTQIDDKSARWELQKSRDVLSEKLNKEILDFCYPSGQVSEKIQSLAKETGYQYACHGRGLLNSSVHNLKMPRQEIFEEEGMRGFIAQLGTPSLAPLKERIKYLARRSIRSRKTHTSF